jgi:hypothetical protein
VNPIPRPTIDITYDNINILRLMPHCGVIEFGWSVIANNSYLVTNDENGRCRCQMWTMPNTRLTLIKACQITIADIAQSNN